MTLTKKITMGMIIEAILATGAILGLLAVAISLIFGIKWGLFIWFILMFTNTFSLIRKINRYTK